jgi:histidyl-tRNA synthetase
MKKQGFTAPELPGLQVLIAYMGDKAREESIKLAAHLRQMGISAVTTTGEKSLKAQLRQANSLNVRYTLIIGEDEVKAGAVTLRDMASARQETVLLTDLVERLKLHG